MSDLIYWISVLLWPAGVAVVVLAVHLQARRSERRWQKATTDEAKGAAVSLESLDRRLRTLEAAAGRDSRTRTEAAE